MMTPGRRVTPAALLTQAPTLLMGLFAGWAWYQASARLLYRWGLEDAAVTGGGVVTAAVLLLLWRLAARDRLHDALAVRRCPACDSALMSDHEHARAGALAGGLQQWRCDGCGFTHAEALTCEQCRP